MRCIARSSARRMQASTLTYPTARHLRVCVPHVTAFPVTATSVTVHACPTKKESKVALSPPTTVVNSFARFRAFKPPVHFSLSCTAHKIVRSAAARCSSRPHALAVVLTHVEPLLPLLRLHLLRFFRPPSSPRYLRISFFASVTLACLRLFQLRLLSLTYPPLLPERSDVLMLSSVSHRVSVSL